MLMGHRAMEPSVCMLHCYFCASDQPEGHTLLWDRFPTPSFTSAVRGTKGRGKKCQICTWWTFSFVLSIYLKPQQVLLWLLHFSPSIIIRLILQDPFKCCFQLSLLNSHHPLSTLAKSVCQPYLNPACNFPWMFLSFINSFSMYLLKIYSEQSTNLRTRDMATFKTDKSPRTILGGQSWHSDIIISNWMC